MKIELTPEEQKEILSDDSESLAARIVVHRMLNSFKEEAKLAMYELMRRRIEEKEEFNFEQYIENAVKENKIDLKLPSFNEIKRGLLEKTIYSALHGAVASEEDEKEEPISPLDDKKQKDLNEVLETLATVLG